MGIYDKERERLVCKTLYLMYRAGEGRMLTRSYDRGNTTFKFVKRKANPW